MQSPLDRAVITLDFAVALRVVRRCFDMRHSGDPNEFFEVTRNELRPIVGDDPRLGIGELFPCPLKNHFDVDLFHLLANFPVNDAARATIEHAAHEVKRAPNVQVTDVNMPVIVGLGRLAEAGSLLGFLAVKPVHHACFSQHPIDT